MNILVNLNEIVIFNEKEKQMSETEEIKPTEERKPTKKTITRTEHICGTCQKSVVKMLPANYHGSAPVCCNKPMNKK